MRFQGRLILASILIIDDNLQFCETLSQLILRLGHVATYALSLREGLEKVSTGVFDVVFLDVWLPDGNGLEALPQIQQTSYQPEVFIVTGLGDADGAELAINSGAWAYIQKPLSMKNISLQLRASTAVPRGKNTSKISRIAAARRYNRKFQGHRKMSEQSRLCRKTRYQCIGHG